MNYGHRYLWWRDRDDRRLVPRDRDVPLLFEGVVEMGTGGTKDKPAYLRRTECYSLNYCQHFILGWLMAGSVKMITKHHCFSYYRVSNKFPRTMTEHPLKDSKI